MKNDEIIATPPGKTIKEQLKQQHMSKKVDDTLVPVPVKLLAQLKAMSAFHRYQTMNIEEVWNEIDKQCEKVEENLSTSMNIVAQARALFEIEKSEGKREAQELIDEMMTSAPGDEGQVYMGLVAITLRKLNKQYEKGK